MVMPLLSTAVPTDPSDSAWGTPRWPEWVKGFRPHQLDAIEEILSLYHSGTDIVLLDAPTGSGKTIIAEAVRRLLRSPQSIYMANTNSLVDQFNADFPYATRLKGRANYSTFDNPAAFNRKRDGLTAADCSRSLMHLPACGKCEKVATTTTESLTLKLHCDHCHPVTSCPYIQARTDAQFSEICVTNTSYFTADGGLGINRALGGRGLVIADECDTLEGILMGHIEVNIPKRTCKELGLNPPERKTVESAWKDWLVNEAKPTVTLAIKRHTATRSSAKVWIRQRDRLVRLSRKLTMLAHELEIGNAVYDGYDQGDIIFKPVKIDHLASPLLWNNARRWLAMSATLFADEFVESLGLNRDDMKKTHAVVTVPSTFPVERRPIYFKGIANNTFKNRDEAWPKMVQGVKAVLAERPDARTLIHTVSYAFTDYLALNLRDPFEDGYYDDKRPIFTYKSASERQAALDLLRATPRSILLAPSMDRGIDLPDEQCEVIIVVKMPFMSTKDKQVQARLYSRGGQTWYSVNTLKSLVQMTGRGMRSAADVCECWILDSQFLTNVWRNNRQLLPSWWTESVDFTGGGI